MREIVFEAKGLTKVYRTGEVEVRGYERPVAVFQLG